MGGRGCFGNKYRYLVIGCMRGFLADTLMHAPVPPAARLVKICPPGTRKSLARYVWNFACDKDSLWASRVRADAFPPDECTVSHQLHRKQTSIVLFSERSGPLEHNVLSSPWFRVPAGTLAHTCALPFTTPLVVELLSEPQPCPYNSGELYTLLRTSRYAIGQFER